MNPLDAERLLYPRVSDIITKQRIEALQAIPEIHLENAAKRGDLIHKLCSMYLNKLWIMEMDSESESYMNAFIEWSKNNIKHVLMTDRRLYDDEKKFTGEFDLIAQIQGLSGPVLVDIKTSRTYSNAWPIQLAAYKRLCDVNGIKVVSACNLHLKKNSNGEVKVKLIPYDDLTTYGKIFQSALDCYDYFHRKQT